MRLALLAVGLSFSAFAQISDLAVSDDGQTVLFRSGFRLQTETDLGTQGKIYQYQNGQWTRVAAALDFGGFAISPPDVFQPFFTSDPSIFGWQINIGCSLCQIIVGPYRSSQLSGVALPQGFPRSNLSVSHNARYFIADSVPFGGPKYLDIATGVVTNVPVDQFAPVIRQVANDGTAVILVTSPADKQQQAIPGALSRWLPGSEPRPIYAETFVAGISLSATGGMLAIETAARTGADAGERNLLVIDTNTGERTLVAPLPAGGWSGLYVSQAAWDTSGTNLIYRAFDDRGQPASIAIWSAATRQSRTLATHDEGFASIAISGDGGTVWAATQSNRVLRIDAAKGATDEVLPPLGVVTSVDQIGVPGSAVLLRGSGFTKTQQAFDGSTILPQSDISTDGYWAQIPWEYNAGPATPRTVTVRIPGNPFESIAHVSIHTILQPDFAYVSAGRGYLKAAHDDFSSLVTTGNPARPGETIHVYMTGLGPLDQPLATGQPGPFSPPAKPLAPVTCQFFGGPSLDVPFADYAAGMIGIYQVDVTMPDMLPDKNQTDFRCSAAGVANGAWLPTTSAR